VLIIVDFILDNSVYPCTKPADRLAQGVTGGGGLAADAGQQQLKLAGIGGIGAQVDPGLQAQEATGRVLDPGQQDGDDRERAAGALLPGLPVEGELDPALLPGAQEWPAASMWPGACRRAMVGTGRMRDMGTAGRGKTSFRAQLDPSGPGARHTGTAPGVAPERCRECGRRHGTVVRCLPDGRWFDADDQTWRDRRGRRARWPNVVEYAGVRDLPVSVRRVRLSAEPGARTRRLCQRCQMVHEAARGAIRRHLRALGRRALGDLFLGAYDRPDAVERFAALARRRRGGNGGAGGQTSADGRGKAPAPGPGPDASR
jgi:hypothetical protein